MSIYPDKKDGVVTGRGASRSSSTGSASGAVYRAGVAVARTRVSKGSISMRSAELTSSLDPSRALLKRRR
jgi:hypothetical protein